MNTNESVVDGAPKDVVNPKDNKPEETGTHQEHIQAALELLYQHFPKAFIKEGNCKPLKIGILEDLKSHLSEIEGLSVSKIRAAVRIYTTRLRYFYSMREGAKRVDLNGNEVDSVSAEHAEYARTRFAEINAARKPAKKKVRRPRPQAQQAQQQNNNNNNARPRRPQQQHSRYVQAKESDIRVGRTVYVSTNRSYEKGTVSEAMRGDKVNVALNNGLLVIMPLSHIFLSTGNPNQRGLQQRRPNNGGNNNNQRFKRRPQGQGQAQANKNGQAKRNDHNNA